MPSYHAPHHEQPFDSSYSVDPSVLMGCGPAEGSYDLEQQLFAMAPSDQGDVFQDEQHHHLQQPEAYPSSGAHSQSASSPSSTTSPSSSAFFPSPGSSATSYSSVVSPTDSHSSPTAQTPSYLLPSPDIYDPSCAPQPEGSWFAEMQDSYLQQHAGSQQHPRYMPSPSASHRSPAASSSYSSSPSPSSPYSRVSTPASSAYSPYARRGSVGSPLPSSRGLGRRPSQLSIAIPPQYSPAMQAGYRMATELGTLPGGPDLAVAPASDIEMDRLMAEIGTILGPEVMASFDTPQSEPQFQQAPPLVEQRRRSSIHRSQTPSGLFQRPRPQALRLRPQRSFDVGNGAAGQDDRVFFESPEFEHRAYPSSAPAWQTSFPHTPAPASYAQYYQQPPPHYTQHAEPSYAYSSQAPFYPPPPSQGPQGHYVLASPPGSHRPRPAPDPTAPIHHQHLGPPSFPTLSHRHSFDVGQPTYPAPQYGHPSLSRRPSAYATPAGYPPSPTRMPKAPRAPRRRAVSAKGLVAKPAINFINFGAAE